MTNKEAFDKISVICSQLRKRVLINENMELRPLLEDELKCLKENLEVLNIIRKYLEFQTLHGDNWALNSIELTVTEIDREDYKHIKNWMQNAKIE